MTLWQWAVLGMIADDIFDAIHGLRHRVHPLKFYQREGFALFWVARFVFYGWVWSWAQPEGLW